MFSDEKWADTCLGSVAISFAQNHRNKGKPMKMNDTASRVEGLGSGVFAAFLQKQRPNIKSEKFQTAPFESHGDAFCSTPWRRGATVGFGVF